MERYQTIRAYSAGGVVFRLAPMHSPVDTFTAHQQFDLFLHSPRSLSNDVDERSVEACTSMTHKPINWTAMEVALVGRSQAGLWALPKGTPRPGETIEQVAVREAQEETGLQVQLIAYIGSITYSFVRDQVRYHKQVRHFLLKAIGGDIALHDHEYDLVRWFSLSEASRLLTYQNEVNILYQAEEMLQRWSQYQHQEGSM